MPKKLTKIIDILFRSLAIVICLPLFIAMFAEMRKKI